jgi:predicted RNase H-like HicB family nuclease
MQMPRQIFYALIHREGEIYVALAPEVGTASQGLTLEEALANVQEATELYLQEFSAPAREGPVFLTAFEVNCPDQ